MDTGGMGALARRIERTATAADVRALGDDQLLVRRAVVANPAAGGRLKAAARIPAADGYEIHVTTRPPRGPSQQMRPRASRGPVGWNPASMALAIDRGAEGAEWDVVSPSGHAVRVRVRSGPAAPHDEINTILGEIERSLLR